MIPRAWGMVRVATEIAVAVALTAGLTAAMLLDLQCSFARDDSVMTPNPGVVLAESVCEPTADESCGASTPRALVAAGHSESPAALPFGRERQCR